MTQRSLAVLIVLNVVLLAAVALTYGPVNRAEAQFGGANYLMIAGNSSQAQQQVVYVMSSNNNGQVAAFTYNSANNQLRPVGRRSVGQDLERAGGGDRGR